MISLQALKQRFEIIGNNTGLNRALEKAIHTLSLGGTWCGDFLSR